jgi:hypothetical protein
MYHFPTVYRQRKNSVLFEYGISRFQERSAELQIPRLRSG